MKRFLLPIKFRMKGPEGDAHIAGSVILPAGILAHTLARRKLSKAPHLMHRFIDPQLYLGQLRPTTSRSVCGNLVTYPWFLAKKTPTYDSGKQDQNTFKREVRARVHQYWSKSSITSKDNATEVVGLAIQFQQMIGTAGVLIPTPLIVEANDDLDGFISFLDAGLAQAELYNVTDKLYATVSLSDTALRHVEPDANKLLDAIIDQVTSRGFYGVYLTIEQSSELGYYCNHPNTVGAMLRLSWGAKCGGITDVIVGPMGLVGFLALGAGADAWSAGWYKGERKLRLAELEDAEGRATPTYYCHKLASEIHTEHDLDRIGRMKIFAEIADSTADSANLVSAIEAGTLVKNVPEWQSRPSNVSAAKDHFCRSVASATNLLSNRSHHEVSALVHQWIASADEYAARLNEVGSFHSRTELLHQASWLEAFVRFRKEAGI